MELSVEGNMWNVENISCLPQQLDLTIFEGSNGQQNMAFLLNLELPIWHVITRFSRHLFGLYGG